MRFLEINVAYSLINKSNKPPFNKSPAETIFPSLFNPKRLWFPLPHLIPFSIAHREYRCFPKYVVSFTSLT